MEPAIQRLDEHLECHALALEILNHLRDPHSAFVHWRARNISTHHVFDSTERAYRCATELRTPLVRWWILSDDRYWSTTWIHEENHEPWCRYFGLDLQMLLSVAVDSSWFTSQQHSQLEEMLKDVVCGSEMKVRHPCQHLQLCSLPAVVSLVLWISRDSKLCLHRKRSIWVRWKRRLEVRTAAGRPQILRFVFTQHATRK